MPVWPKPLPWPVLIYSSYCLLKHIKITSHHTKLMMNHHRRRSIMTLTNLALLKMATSLQSKPWSAFYCHRSVPTVQLTIIYHWLMPQSHPTMGSIQFLAEMMCDFLPVRLSEAPIEIFMPVLFSWSHRATGPHGLTKLYTYGLIE